LKGKRLALQREVLDSMFTYFQASYPDEGILLLRGKVDKHALTITGVVIPPSAVHGEYFSQFSPWFLPLDRSILGVAHSHPSGSAEPSEQDSMSVYGSIMVIVGYPFKSTSDVAVYDKDGNPIAFTVVD
jgi:proteasome lid subunit RPN8/RPN11